MEIIEGMLMIMLRSEAHQRQDHGGWAGEMMNPTMPRLLSGNLIPLTTYEDTIVRQASSEDGRPIQLNIQNALFNGLFSLPAGLPLNKCIENALKDGKGRLIFCTACVVPFSIDFIKTADCPS